MKKILIISYFYPPCNLTAAQRIKGWTDSLHKHGYYPIVVTRNWNVKSNSPKDQLKSIGSATIHEKNDTHEVYYLPYKASLRDRLFNSNNRFAHLLSKVFTVFNLISENYTIGSIPYKNMYHFSEQLLEEDKDIKGVIVSANPFNQFHFGYLLNKKTGIPWLADYRDDWTTSEINSQEGIINQFILKLQEKSEKKWVQSASLVTSISQHYCNKIEALVDVPTKVLLNGYSIDKALIDHVNANPKKFVITYNGSLYPTQDIETFAAAFLKCFDEYQDQIKIQINFPGLAFDPIQSNRVKNLFTAVKNNVLITPRLPREEVLQMQADSDLLLMLSHNGLKGIPSSKLYEYIGLKKRVLLFPTDHDIIAETLEDTGVGIIANDQESVYHELKTLIENKLNESMKHLELNEEKIRFYSREQQTGKLAEYLDSFL